MTEVVTVHGKVLHIVDELCTCGHRKSEHAETPAGVPNHGPCTKCECLKFTFADFVYAED